MSIILKGISFNYGNKKNFSNLDLEIPDLRCVVITGKCGSGKTTLAKLIAGILELKSGEIMFHSKYKGRPKIGYIFQNPDDQFIQLSIEKEIAFNLENDGIEMVEMEKIVTDQLKKYGFSNRRKDSPNSLSGGEKQKLALAGMLVSNPEILIMDEPTSFLDIVDRVEFYENIRKLQKEGLSIIWISHEEDEIYLSDYVIELENFQVKFSGERDEYICGRLK